MNLTPKTCCTNVSSAHKPVRSTHVWHQSDCKILVPILQAGEPEVSQGAFDVLVIVKRVEGVGEELLQTRRVSARCLTSVSV